MSDTVRRMLRIVRDAAVVLVVAVVVYEVAEQGVEASSALGIVAVAGLGLVLALSVGLWIAPGDDGGEGADDHHGRRSG